MGSTTVRSVPGHGREGQPIDTLESARTKLVRGNMHKAQARKAAISFFRRCPIPTYRVEPEDGTELSFEVGAENTCRLVLDVDLPAIPTSFGARFGDAIHNYRCSLDHVAWQLVKHGARWPLSEREMRAVQFPIYREEARFDGNVNRLLPGVCETVRAYIKDRHLFVRGTATNRALLALAEISNIDKHRELHVFAGYVRHMKTGTRATRCEILSWTNPESRPALMAGSTVARFTYRVTGPDHELAMKPEPLVELRVERGGEFTTLLEGISAEASAIVGAAPIVAAVQPRA